MAKKLRNNVMYLVHDINSGVGNLNYAIKRIKEKYPEDLSAEIQYIEGGIKRIKDIEDYFYKWAKEQEEWNAKEE